MTTSLPEPPATLDALARAERAFLKRLAVHRPERLAARGIAGHVARTYGLGSGGGGWVEFRSEDFERAKRLLLDPEGRAAPVAVAKHTEKLEPRAPGRRRVPAVDVGKPPHDVAVLPVGVAAAVPADFPQHFIATDARAQALRRFPVLIVCDSLDVMAHLQRFAWLLADLGERSAIAIYRGDSGRFREKTATGLIQACAKSEIWFAGDFQPRVLWAAARLPRLSRLCYPDVEAIEQIPAQLAIPSSLALLRHYAQKVGDTQGEPIASAWAAMSRVGRCFYVRDFPEGIRRTARRSVPA